MNVCKFSKGELSELGEIVKRQLRSKQMLGKQASCERLSLKREDGGRKSKPMRDVYKLARELGSMRDVYKEGGLCVAC